MSAPTVIKDCSWRWQTGGLRSLSAEQQFDAEQAFDTWLRKCGSFMFEGFRVDNLSGFVNAVQSANTRTCGLETVEFSARISEDSDWSQSAAIEQAVERLKRAQEDFLTVYNGFDQYFEEVKKFPIFLNNLDYSEQAQDLDQQAWQFSWMCMQAAETVNRANGELIGSPLRQPFLVQHTQRWIDNVFALSFIESIDPVVECPFKGEPEQLSRAERKVVEDWLVNHAKQSDKNIRCLSAQTVDISERAAMMRWLEKFDRLDQMAAKGERLGFKVTATGIALTGIQREDLRELHKEISGYMQLSKELDQIQTQSEQTSDREQLEKQTKIIARLEEMQLCHKSRASYFWIRSFHFDPSVQREAACLQPKLINRARKMFGSEVDQSSGEVGVFMQDKLPQQKEALRDMAQASQSLRKTGEIKRTRGFAALTDIAKGFVNRIIGAGRMLGSEFVDDMRTTFPAMAKQTTDFIANSKPTRMERLAQTIDDWRIVGLAAADRSMRGSHETVVWERSRQNLIAYAQAVCTDLDLMQTISKKDSECALWVEKIARAKNKSVKISVSEPILVKNSEEYIVEKTNKLTDQKTSDSVKPRVRKKTANKSDEIEFGYTP